MKNLMFALLATLALQSQAQDFGPVSALPLVQMRIGGGMPAPEVLTLRTITVLTSGNVLVHEVYSGKNWNTKGKELDYQLPALRHSDMRMLAMNIAQLSGGPFKTSDQPQCMDAPSTHYSIYRDDQITDVYKRVACVDLELADESQNGPARFVKLILDELNAKTSTH